MVRTRNGSVAGFVSNREFTSPGTVGGLSASPRWCPATALRAPGSPADLKKIETGTLRHSENRLESTLDPDFYPVVVKIAKIHFLDGFVAKKVPKWLAYGPLDKKKYFF